MSIVIHPDGNEQNCLSFSNESFAALWDNLGLDVQDFEGEIQPHAIQAALREKGFIRIPSAHQDWQSDQERASRATMMLATICLAAEKAEDWVVWY